MNKDQTPLAERLRECADEVMEFPRPSHCQHLHDAAALMREAASEVEAARAQTAAEPPEPQWKDLDYTASPSFHAPAPSGSPLDEWPRFGKAMAQLARPITGPGSTPEVRFAWKLWQAAVGASAAAPAPGVEEGTGVNDGVKGPEHG